MPPSTRIVAEIGSVHDGSIGNALRLIEVAAACGADAVKFQTHIAEAETTADAPPPPYFQEEPRFDYFERTAFDEPQWLRLCGHAETLGLTLIASPFSVAAVELLERIGLAEYKIASGEVSNLPLLQAVAATRKPVLLSSGMASWEELDAAVEILEPAGGDLTILQCTSEYPCPPERVGLNVLADMRERYGRPVGLSDHTLTPWASIAAVALGATVIERHLTFSRAMYGSDAPHSLEPTELRQLVEGIRTVEAVLANPVDKADTGRFTAMKAIFEKSLVAAVDIPADEVVTRAMLAAKRPGTGLPTKHLDSLVGRRTTRAVPRDALISLDDLSDGAP
ncbi:MAG: N-acetylneuraminate synthase family protein [Solirubrobacteraceae bacterium]